jgi:flagellar protein FliJ
MRRVSRGRRSQRIARIVGLAEHEERHECQQMMQVQQVLDKAVGKLTELLSYRQNYEAGSRQIGTVSAVRWQDYRRFLARLDQAVEFQNRLILDHRQSLEANQRRWREKRQRLEMLEQIQQRYFRAEADHDERQMQKLLDDLRPMESLFAD